MRRRVIQFSTGNVGHHALRLIVERPDLELVGVHASGAGKIGKDAAELCGLSDPTGVVATDDIGALLALHADCVVYTSQAETRPPAAVAEISRFLAAGTNVVGTSMVWLVAPDYADDRITRPLRDACNAGDTSLFINGIDPGFSGDTLPYAALSLSAHAERITVQEVFDYATYDDAEFTGASFGFGTTPDHTPVLFAPGVLSSIWGGQVRALARALGVELDQLRERHESWPTPKPVTCPMMTVRQGCVAAVRFAVEGWRGGKPVITMEHVNRLTDAAAPEWPYPPDGRLGVHRVVIDGSPGVEINAHVGLHGVDHNEGGVIATAARAVNAIDAVCGARPGILAAADLMPTAHAHGAMW
jgi:2,4-diaminopentanoate dehydrogenase